MMTGPYRQSELNHIYQMLFADELALFQPRPGVEPALWQEVLFAAQPDVSAIRRLADDETAESRVRLLAYHWLRQQGHTVEEKELLGTVLEVALDGGLDTLAAYADGGVRYINQAGGVTMFETSPPQVREQAERLLAESRRVVSRIGPTDQPRLAAPPPPGSIRMSFLVSDGLYFGQGGLDVMQQEPLAAPIVREGGRLLQLVVDTALAAKKQGAR